VSTLRDPPNGWYTFGTHAVWDAVPPLEFSDETGEDGMPLFERPAADAAVTAALRSVVDYCRLSESFAGEGMSPEAAGLARAYKDVADRLDERLARAPSADDTDAPLLSRLLFESRERVEMAADMVERRTGQTDDWGRRLVAEIDAYRAGRGWSPNGFGGER
jgi:hypothetical protein